MAKVIDKFDNCETAFALASTLHAVDRNYPADVIHVKLPDGRAVGGLNVERDKLPDGSVVYTIVLRAA